MIRGVRQAEEAQALGVSRRLLVRLGALLKKSVEISPAVLELARPGSPYENLLLDPAVLEQAGALDEDLLERLAPTRFPAGTLYERLTVAAGPEGVRVICLPEELEAGEGWEAEPPQAAGPAAGAERNVPPGTTALAPGQATMPARPLMARMAEAGAQRRALFTPVEIERLRLKLVTASDPRERVEALRLLAYAPLPQHEKAEVIFRALEDREAALRAEGAGLLFLLGVSDELAEALRGLSEGDEAARLRGAERAVKLLTPETPELARAAVAVSALAALRPEAPGPCAARLLEVLQHSAMALAHAPPRLAELLRGVLALLGVALARSAGPLTQPLYGSAHGLLRALASAAPAVMLPLLKEECGKAADRSVEAFLLQMLLEACAPGAPDEAEMMQRCARYVAADTEEGRDSRAVGMTMAARPEGALVALAEVFGAATPGAQKYILRLSDDLVRYRGVPAQAKARFAANVLRAADSTHRPLRMAAMGCRGMTDAQVPEGLRARFAEALLNSIGDFGFHADIEMAEDTVALLGLPAVAALTRRLAAEWSPEQRAQAVRILGNLALELKPAPGELPRTAQVVTDLLRQLRALALEQKFPDRRVLLVALGKLAACPAASGEAAAVVTRYLQERLAAPTPPEQLAALEALTWVAGAHRGAPELILDVVQRLKRIVTREEEELLMRTREEDGPTVFVVGGAETVVEWVPVALRGISRIARSRSCPASVLRDVVKVLLERWQKIAAGTLLWGPGTSLCLVQALQEIGCQPGLPDEVRLEILKGLAPRLMFAPVLPAIGAILGVADTPATAAAAASVGAALIRNRGPDGRYEPQDRPDILRVLGRIAARKHLGAPNPAGQEKALRFREAAVEELLRGAQDLVPGVYDALVALRDARVLPAEAQAGLQRRLAEFHALAVPLDAS